jgi:hypothetical protein
MITGSSKPKFSYRTLAQTLREDAYRHMRRAGKYAADGNFQNADGSAAKATKKFIKANLLDRMFVIT